MEIQEIDKDLCILVMGISVIIQGVPKPTI